MGDDYAKILEELDAVKRLMILFLIKLGSDSKEIGMALGISDASVRKIMSMRKVKKLDFTMGDE